MNSLFGDVASLIQHSPWLAVAAVFVGGIMTALNPCVLAMVPLMIGLVGGRREAEGVGRAFLFSLFFVLGLSATFTALGLISSLLGRMFGDVGRFWKYLVAAVCLIMGAHLLGLFKFNFRTPAAIRFVGKGYFGAFLLGLFFGVVSTPCAVPILAVLLAFVAEKGNVVYGASLLFVYALGHSSLVLIAGTSMGAAQKLIAAKGLHQTLRIIQKAAGVIIILVGIYFVAWK